MPKLSEILAKQRAERLGNVTQTQSGSSQKIEPTTVREISIVTEKTEGIGTGGGAPISQIIGGNGSNGGQKEPTVVSKRLGILARLKGKENEIQRTTDVSEEPKQVLETVPKSDVDTLRNSGDKLVLDDKHSQKTNDGTVDVESLRKNLEYLALNIEQKELVGNVVRTIAMQLRSQPELIPYMKEADVDLVVRGLRRSYNVAVRAKTEKAEKKGKSTALDVELAGVMKDIGFKLGS